MRDRIAARAAALMTPFVVFALVAGCQPAEQGQMGAAVDTAAVMTAVDSVRNAYQSAYNAGDAAGVASLYAQDAVFLPPMAPAINGRQAIQKYLAQELAAAPSLEISPASTSLVARDWVVEHGTATVTMTPEGAEEPVSVTSGYLVVLQRTAQGWKLSRTANSPQGPPPGMMGTGQ